MNKKFSQLRMILVAVFVVLTLLMWVSTMITDDGWIIAVPMYLIGVGTIYFVYYNYTEDNQNRVLQISDVVSSEISEALTLGQVGILSYDKDYVITWMSEFFEERGINRISKKLFSWLPEAQAIFKGEVETVIIEVEDVCYEVSRKEDSQVLYFKDVTDLTKIRTKYNNEQLVMGIIHLDNYEETTQYLEEHEVANINSSIRQPIFDWCRNHEMLVKRLKSDRFLLMLDEEKFAQIANDRFTILKQTRNRSAELDVAITLSVAFARGTNNLLELEDTANSLLALAMSRGGDQVAYRKKGEDVRYFGGSSEALEKRSRVRVRIIANAIKGLLAQASNVIIVGHKEMDFDCLGSALCMSRIAQSFDIPTCIVYKTGGIEEKLNDVCVKYKKELEERHHLVSESEALNQLRANTLVIMVDHHKASVSNGAAVLAKAAKVVIIDHHRRSAELDVSPVLIYLEASASSTSELVAEFMPYFSSNIEIDSIESTIMLAGVTVDTNRFRVRTGARTFDAASAMRKWGADPSAVNEYLKDRYVDFETKNNVLKYCEMLEHGVVVAPVSDRGLSRSMMSQIADMILSVKEVNAAFVIAKTSDVETAVSARSNGTVNVQMIMERMKGGGHMTAAALQRDNTTIADVKVELLQTVQDYFKEEKENESHLT